MFRNNKYITYKAGFRRSWELCKFLTRQERLPDSGSLERKETCCSSSTCRQWNFTINFAHCCVCGYSHILFCLGIHYLAHVGLSLICISTENIRTCNSKSWVCWAIDFVGDQEEPFDHEGLAHDCLIVCTKSIRKIRDCPEMVKKYSFNKAEKPHGSLSSLITHFSSGFETLLVHWVDVPKFCMICKMSGISMAGHTPASVRGLLIWGDMQLFLYLLSPFH